MLTSRRIRLPIRGAACWQLTALFRARFPFKEQLHFCSLWKKQTTWSEAPYKSGSEDRSGFGRCQAHAAPGTGGGVEGAPPGREEWDVARPTGDSWRCAPWGGPGKPRHVATRTPVRSERGGGGGPAHLGTARDRQTAVTATGWAAPRGRCRAEGPRGTANICTKC